MMRIIKTTIALLFLSLSFVAANAASKQERLARMRTDMLAPTVMILAGAGEGSGNLIYSQLRCPALSTVSPFLCKKGVAPEPYTHVLTNFHVIVARLFEQDPVNPGAKKRRTTPLLIEVVLYHYGDTIDKVESFAYEASVVAESEGKDLALLRVKKEHGVFSQVARLAPKRFVPYRPDDAWTAGASLRLVPFLAYGLFGNAGIGESGVQLIQTTAPVFFGSSGGGLYYFSEKRGRYELVGVTTQFLGDTRGRIAAPHLSVSVGLKTIYEFLEENNFGFIVEAHNPQ